MSANVLERFHESRAAEVARRWGARLAAWGVIVTAFFLPISIAGAQCGGGVVGLGVLLALGSGARGLLPRGLGLPVASFIGLCLVASAVSPVDIPPQGWVAWRPVLFVVLVPAAFALCERPERLLRAAIGALLLTALAAALLGLYQRSTGFDLLHTLGLRRAPIRIPAPVGAGFASVGTFNSRLTFSAVQAAVLVFGLSLALSGRVLSARIAGAVSVLTSGLAVAGTFARAAWLGVGCGMATLILGLGRKKAVAVLIVGALAVGAGAMVPSVRERAVSAVKTTANGDRLFIWSRAGEVIADYPTQGVGVYGYPAVAAPYYDRHNPLFTMRTWTHDMYLTLVAEAGVGGLMAYVWILVTVFALAIGGLRGARSGPVGVAVRVGALAAVVSLLEQSLFHDVLYDAEASMTLFFFAGLAVCCLRPASEPAPSAPAEE